MGIRKSLAYALEQQFEVNFFELSGFSYRSVLYLMSGKSQAPMETNFSHRDNLELSVQESREAELPVLGELKVRN